ncbi:Cytochrome b6-f complex subunit 7 [Hibiscus syriacus]|uniref:Cytochrome b6-f complex subunit 7 n=1 Tax=Hibiscus syriacus TaxID=106335 RepID=A0A6A3C7R6_HIBSY|nr:uncharacterized protein LOC120203494 [Hibiscus syriacus]KAE8724774.1 Cytochrome b6-f complex subunit 7 [Hibiscus syriacus]
MATTASATLSPPTLAAATVGSPRRRTAVNVSYIAGLNSFGGLKAHNSVVSLGQPVCIEQSFANVVSSLKAPSRGNGRGRGGGGSLSSTCNAVGEIFRIAAIMNGLVLVGVAVGFVLLRIEAFGRVLSENLSNFVFLLLHEYISTFICSNHVYVICFHSSIFMDVEP